MGYNALELVELLKTEQLTCYLFVLAIVAAWCVSHDIV